MKSLQDLNALRDKVKAQMGIREGSVDETFTKVVVGMATSGIEAGARAILQAFVKEVADKKLDKVVVSQSGSLNTDSKAPVVEIIEPDGRITVYAEMTPERVVQVVTQHLIENKPVSEYAVESSQKK